NGDLGIVEAKPEVGRRVVIGGAGIGDVRDLAEHAEAVRESIRAPQLVVGDVVELKALPVAERPRTAPDVHDDIEDRAPRAAHELAHARLKVHSAYDASPRPGVVVLHELGGDAEL